MEINNLLKNWKKENLKIGDLINNDEVKIKNIICYWFEMVNGIAFKNLKNGDIIYLDLDEIDLMKNYYPEFFEKK